MDIDEALVQYITEQIKDTAPLANLRFKYGIADLTEQDASRDVCVVQITNIQQPRDYGGDALYEEVSILMAFIFQRDRRFRDKLRAIKAIMFDNLARFGGNIGGNEVTRVNVLFGSQDFSDLFELASAIYTLDVQYNI